METLGLPFLSLETAHCPLYYGGLEIPPVTKVPGKYFSTQWILRALLLARGEDDTKMKPKIRSSHQPWSWSIEMECLCYFFHRSQLNTILRTHQSSGHSLNMLKKCSDCCLASIMFNSRYGIWKWEETFKDNEPVLEISSLSKVTWYLHICPWNAGSIYCQNWQVAFVLSKEIQKFTFSQMNSKVWVCLNPLPSLVSLNISLYSYMPRLASVNISWRRTQAKDYHGAS